MRAHFFQDILRVLIRHEAKIDLCHSVRGQHRLCPLSGVTADQSGNIASRSERGALAQGQAGQAIDELLNFKDRFQLLFDVALIGEGL